jgi:hypothetical protein
MGEGGRAPSGITKNIENKFILFLMIINKVFVYQDSRHGETNVVEEGGVSLVAGFPTPSASLPLLG